MPANQPAANAGPLMRARTLPSKSTTTMTGTGLTAMATASGSIWPIASPIPTRGSGCCGAS